MTDKCLLCPALISEENYTEEHVIPNALGGFRKVTGFICNSCNRNTGSSWEAALAKQLESLAVLLNIKRDRGEVKPRAFKTESGKSVHLSPDGTMKLAIPDIGDAVPTGNNGFTIKARVGDMKQAKKLAEGLSRKHKQATRIGFKFTESTTPAEPLIINLNFGGDDSGRSLIKSCLAQLKYSGIDPHICDDAVRYLINENQVACFGYYYTKDIVVNRPLNVPLHALYIRGDSVRRKVLAYIEVYGCQRMVGCLASSYVGDNFETSYAINPMSGEELNLTFNLELNDKELQDVYDYKHFDMDCYKDAIASVAIAVRFQSVQNQFKVELEESQKAALEHFNLSCISQLTEENHNEFVGIISQRMTDFYIENVIRAKYSK
ncbi:hypothetical protein JCM19238_4410 [Vibrio ponticus]|nr:hypothetical protein JCM19238_4410 [Vibrio ponticus]